MPSQLELSKLIAEAISEIGRLREALREIEVVATHNTVLIPHKIAEFCRETLMGDGDTPKDKHNG